MTDDISIKDKGSASLEFVPTKYSGIDRWKSRKGIRCRLVTEDDGTAGFRLDRKGLKPDDTDMWDQYKTFEMTFENAHGKHYLSQKAYSPMCADVSPGRTNSISRNVGARCKGPAQGEAAAQEGPEQHGSVLVLWIGCNKNHVLIGYFSWDFEDMM